MAKGRSLCALATLFAGAALLSGCLLEAGSEDEPIGTQAVSITGLQKVCSVSVPSLWRDTLNVPDGWTRTLCIAFASKVGATHYRVGCIPADGKIKFGTEAALTGIAGEPGCGVAW